MSSEGKRGEQRLWDRFVARVRTLAPDLAIEVAGAALIAGIAFALTGAMWIWIVLAVVASAVAIWASTEVERSRRLPAVTALVAREGHYFIGMDIGRTQMSYGVLEVPSDDVARLPDKHRPIWSTTGPSPLDPDQGLSVHRIYDDIAERIRSLVPYSPRQIDGIGFGVPGQITPATGDVDSPNALGTGRNFIVAMRRRLAADPDLMRAIGMAEPAMAEQQQREEMVEGRLFVDNDVRCATRAILSERHTTRDWREWRDFACVFVGTGVGAGYVLQGSVYYGPAFTAGEVGHMTIHLSRDQHGFGFDPPGLVHVPEPCGCGGQGVHWETLVSGPGLEAIAHQLDPERSAALASEFRAPTREGGVAAPQITLVAELLEGRQASERSLMAVENSINAACARTGDAPHAAEEVVPAVGAAVKADPGMQDYINDVLRTHARYFTIGVANLVNVLNISRLALGGGVMDGLWPREAYKREWNAVRQEYALRRPLAALKEPHHDEDLRPGWAWVGSALLPRDPSYIAARQGRPYASAPG